MHDLDLLVPSALVDPALAPDLLRDQALPNLARVVGRAASIAPQPLPSDALLASWQAWVFATRAGVAIETVNVAELWAMAGGVAPAPRAGRYLVEPAHFTIAKDHLRLDDPHGLDITLAEARALAAAAEPILADAGWRLAPVEATTLSHWPLERDDGALAAPAIDRAIGDNVAAWQPRALDRSAAGGDAALAWRRCVNEIQMHWFGHPVNEAREAQGRPTINTLWLSGNGAPRSPQPTYAKVDSSLPLVVALAVEPDAPRGLESFDALVAPARADDWSAWRVALAALDVRIGEILQLQAASTVGAVTLILCGADGSKSLSFTRRDFAKFWRGWRTKPPLAALFSALPP